ncbi:MAG: ThuA domain-containing protein [Halieaceae bacterium]|nr:ThuA domain-containing protein [Halieaceae bacterium]
MLFKFLKILVLLTSIMAMVALAAIWQVGAWNLVFPSVHHDTVAPQLPPSLASPGILLFTKTNGFRHRDGITGGAAFLEGAARERGWGIFHTENGAIFNERDLQRFQVVIFLNASGDMLSAEQEAAFETWLQDGGGWLGVHSAGDSSHEGWHWYRDNLIGADFTAHIMGPQFQTATVLTESHDHPVVKDMPSTWQHEEEWYSWEKSPRPEGFTILATIDEASYQPIEKFMGNERDLSMGDHPVVWSNCVGKGRSVYLTMGHKADAFEQPNVQRLIVNSVLWLTDVADSVCPTPD